MCVSQNVRRLDTFFSLLFYAFIVNNVCFRFYHSVFGDKLPKTEELAKAWLERIPKLLWMDYMYFLASKKISGDCNLLSMRHSKFPPWTSSDSDLVRWKQGITGYPYVDAIMRQFMQVRE